MTSKTVVHKPDCGVFGPIVNCFGAGKCDCGASVESAPGGKLGTCDHDSLHHAKDQYGPTARCQNWRSLPLAERPGSVRLPFAVILGANGEYWVREVGQSRRAMSTVEKVLYIRLWSASQQMSRLRAALGQIAKCTYVFNPDAALQEIIKITREALAPSPAGGTEDGK